jgi:hypothetical protein
MIRIKLICLSLLMLSLISCGGSSQSASSLQPTEMAGSWSIAIVDNGQTDTIQTTLVPSGTTVPSGFGLPSGTVTSCSWPVGDVVAVGPVCFTAANSALASLGSLSDSNSLILPLQLVVGVPENPAPAGSAVSFAFAEDYNDFSYYWVFNGTGTVTNGSISGSWECNVAATISCAGMSGTFSGTRSTSNAGCAPVPQGIVSWWKGEDNALDQEGANPGTVEGGVNFSLGKVGQAFYFDGSTGYVDVPDSSSLQAISTTVTVEMWVQPTVPSTGGYLYARRDPITSENFSVYVQNDGTLTVLLRTTTSPTETGSKFASAPGAVAFGQTQHIAATANLTTSSVNAYVNGVAVPLTVVYGPASLGGTFAPVTHLYLGRREDPGLEGQAGAAYFPGMLDEVSLYSTALTQSQIEAIVSAGSAGKCQ